MKLLNNKQRS